MTQHLLKNSFLRGVLFLLLCAIGLGNAWGEKVTFKLHTGEVTDGYYIIVSNGVAMNNQTYKNRLQYDDVTISNDIIQAESNARYVWYISSEGNGTYTIKNANNNYYVASTGTKNQATTRNTTIDDKDKWYITNNETTWSIENVHNKTNSINYTIRRNDTYGFACYAASTGAGPILYKKTEAPTKTVTGLAISGTASNTTYYVGDTPSAEGLVVTATYNDESTKDVTSSVSWSFEPDTIQSNTISVTATASYEGITASTPYNITNKGTRTLSSIKIGGEPAKTSYHIGDTPSAEGLTVKAIYSKGEPIDVTGDVTWTFNPETITEETTQVTATATYNGLTDSHTYNISAKITDYTLLEDGKKYYIGATLSNGTDYYFSTTYTNIVEAVKGVAQTDKANANILTAIANSSDKTKWAFQFENGYYLSLKDSQDNGKVRIIAQKTYWVLSNTTKGLINMTTNGFCLQRNNSTTTTNFGSYSNTQTNIWFLEVPTYDVEISSAGLATFCLPYNATIPDGLTAYTATDNGKSVILTAKEGGKIAAGEGVVLKGNEGTYTFVAAEGSVNPTAENQMVGVTEDTELTEADNAYMLTRKIDDGSIAFRLLKTNYTLEANRAYLKVDGSANTRELIPALWDDNATGIDNIAKDEATATGAIYNLAGQKLMRAQKGINIINGKLVIK